MKALVKAKPEPGLWMQDVAEPVPGDGEVLLRTRWLSLDPYMRGRMSAPALAGFQHTGELTLLTNGERHNLHAMREDEGQVKAFFRSCAAA
mgnify:CR=1 FL=1